MQVGNPGMQWNCRYCPLVFHCHLLQSQLIDQICCQRKHVKFSNRKQKLSDSSSQIKSSDSSPHGNTAYVHGHIC
eukprot:284563-Amorphochlora_amoeboformis.AAC.1